MSNNIESPFVNISYTNIAIGDLNSSVKQVISLLTSLHIQHVNMLNTVQEAINTRNAQYTDTGDHILITYNELSDMSLQNLMFYYHRICNEMC